MCSLDEEKFGEKVKKIAKEVNEHGHSKSCKKGNPKCRWKFPRFPLIDTVFVDKKRKIPEEEKLSEEQRNSILDRVKCDLVDDIDGKEEKSKTVDKNCESKGAASTTDKSMHPGPHKTQRAYTEGITVAKNCVLKKTK